MSPAKKICKSMVDEGGKELANFATKLMQLELAMGRSETLNVRNTLTNEANECRRLAKAERIAKKEEVSEIKEWNSI